MPKTDNTPKMLKPYEFFGIDLDYSDSSDDAKADCPFCGKEGKFVVDIANGVSRCWNASCKNTVSSEEKSKGGWSITSFIRELHKRALEASKPGDLQLLVQNRKLLFTNTLVDLQIVKSPIDDSYLIPGWSVLGRVNSLYKYAYSHAEKRSLLWPTPKPVGHQLFARNLYHKKREIVCLFEGIWDLAAFYEAIGHAKETDDGLEETGNADSSLLANVSVLAIPTATIWRDDWVPLFKNKKVVLFPQNDHPIKHPEIDKETPPASQSQFKFIANVIGRVAESVGWHPWAEWYDADLPHGYDIRDLLTR